MKTKYALIAFAITAIAQLFIPAKMVYDNHITETEGTVYKFKAGPVDPADPFRGRYITLNFEADTFAIAHFKEQEGKVLYALPGRNADGFAKIKNVTFTVPKSGDYIKVDSWYYTGYNNTLHLDLPFDRYYMEESKAPEAELLYAEYAAQKDGLPVYGEVAVKGGIAVLKGVIINGMPIEEYVRKQGK